TLRLLVRCETFPRSPNQTRVWCSPVAGAAASQHCRAAQLVLLHQRRTARALVPALRRPVHREDVLLRSNELLRVAMTFEAPLHLQRRYLIRQRHQVDSPVTGGATNAFVDVNAVIEIDEVRQIVHSSPVY